jgi:phage tail-like protein
MRRRVSFALTAAVLVGAVAAVGLGPPASAGPARKDPHTVFCFRVTITSDPDLDRSAAHFKSIGGLRVETEVVDYQEGGLNEVLRRPGRTLAPTLSFRRDFAGQRADDPVLRWYRDVLAGKDVRKDLTITLVKRTKSGDEDVAAYDCRRCFPVKWSVSDVDADGSEVVTETVEVAVERISPP